MGTTCTAEVIFGKADQNSSGIQFNHRVTLYEGFRPMLVFERKPSLDQDGSLVDRWIPNLDRLAEDIMVMMAGYSTGDGKTMELIGQLKEGREAGEIIDLNEADPDLMDQLYTASRMAFRLNVHQTKNYIRSDRQKITACLFEKSSLEKVVRCFLDYDIDLEVCRTIFKSEYSPWSRQIDVWGELK